MPSPALLSVWDYGPRWILPWIDAQFSINVLSARLQIRIDFFEKPVQFPFQRGYQT